MPGAQALIVVEHPSPRDKAAQSAMIGNISKRVLSELASRGVRRVNVIYRIACCPPTALRNDSILRKAAARCKRRFVADLESCDPANTLPVLLLGKHSANDWLATSDVVLRSGNSKRLPTAKLCADIPYDRYVRLAHPAIAFWHRAPTQVIWLAGLNRFARLVHGQGLPAPPLPLVTIGDTMLEALRAMGQTVGWDVETLGVDPMTSPITCIGISDGERIVSAPWDDYSTASQGDVIGVANARSGIGALIRDEIISILQSGRKQVTQNGSYDVLAVRAKGLPGRNDADIMHMHKILWPETRADLESIGVHVVDRLRRRWKTVFKGGDERDGVAKGADVFRDTHPLDLRDYNGYDAWVTVAAEAPLSAELAKED